MDKVVKTAVEAVGVNADILGSGTLYTRLVKILGTGHFYWDSDSIVMVDPSDGQKRIKIGQYLPNTYGIAVSRNGGETWAPAVDFNGVRGGGSGGTTIVQQDMIKKQGLAPTNPTVNDLWVDTILHRLMMWDGKEWVVIGYEPPVDPDTPKEPEDPDAPTEPGDVGGEDDDGKPEGGGDE